MKIALRINFIAIFPLLPAFATCLKHRKQNADVSKVDIWFRFIFLIFRKCMPEAISTPNLAAIPVNRQGLGRGHFCLPKANHGVSDCPITIGLN